MRAKQTEQNTGYTKQPIVKEITNEISVSQLDSNERNYIRKKKGRWVKYLACDEKKTLVISESLCIVHQNKKNAENVLTLWPSKI